MGLSVESDGGAVIIITGGIDMLGCCWMCEAAVDVAAAPGGGRAGIIAYKDCGGDDDKEAVGSLTATLPPAVGGCC